MGRKAGKREKATGDKSGPRLEKSHAPITNTGGKTNTADDATGAGPAMGAMLEGRACEKALFLRQVSEDRGTCACRGWTYPPRGSLDRSNPEGR